MKKKIFILGHSHLGAIMLNLRVSPIPGVEIDFVLCNEDRYKPLLIDDALNPLVLERISSAKADLYVSMLGGNDHSILSMLNHPRRFDVVLPEAPELYTDISAEVLPAGLVLAVLSKRVDNAARALTAYSAAAGRPMVHVESPPPIPSEEHIRNYPGVFRDVIAAQGVSPALLRYKFWRLHSRLYREACERLAVSFLPAPTEMQDTAGMMIERAWNPDPTHGNALYGAAVIDQLLREVA